MQVHTYTATAHYAGAEQHWGRVAEACVNQEVAPLLAEIASAEPPADVAHLYASVESWRRAAVAETRRTASNEAYGRAVVEWCPAVPSGDTNCGVLLSGPAK